MLGFHPGQGVGASRSAVDEVAQREEAVSAGAEPEAREHRFERFELAVHVAHHQVASSGAVAFHTRDGALSVLKCRHRRFLGPGPGGRRWRGSAVSRFRDGFHASARRSLRLSLVGEIEREECTDDQRRADDDGGDRRCRPVLRWGVVPTSTAIARLRSPVAVDARGRPEPIAARRRRRRGASPSRSPRRLPRVECGVERSHGSATIGAPTTLRRGFGASVGERSGCTAGSTPRRQSAPAVALAGTKSSGTCARFFTRTSVDPCGGFASPCTTMHIRSSGLPATPSSSGSIGAMALMRTAPMIELRFVTFTHRAVGVRGVHHDRRAVVGVDAKAPSR